MKTVDKLSKGQSNFESVLASQNCVFGKAGLGFNPQNKQDRFSKLFSKMAEKQSIGPSKQPNVTCLWMWVHLVYIHQFSLYLKIFFVGNLGGEQATMVLGQWMFQAHDRR